MSKETRKQGYFAKLIELLDKHPKLIIVGCDNVGSFHMQTIRKKSSRKSNNFDGKEHNDP
jgi:ribosomal protein L10